MAQSKDELPHRPCVGIMMVNARNEVFVGRRIDTPGQAWQMPQGGIDDGEDPKDAALRELEEETGTRNVEFIGETEGWIDYDLPGDLVGKVWKGRYRGQTQKWFAVRFLGTDQDIDVTGVPHPEFDDWRWVSAGELVDLVIPFKREVYKQVVAELCGIVGRPEPTTR